MGGDVTDSRQWRFKRATDVVSRTIGTEVVLLDLRSGKYFGLNATGAAIWESMETSSASLDSMMESVRARFEDPGEDLRGDVEGLLGDLESNGLIVREGG